MSGPPIITHDFESRSACDLNKHGSWLYSLHPTTEVMCLRYNLPWEGNKVRLWHMAHTHLLMSESPPPEDLFRAIKDGCLMEAHNAFFEYVIWLNQMRRLRGWPVVPTDQYRCSAAKASAMSLPRKLELVAEALHLPVQKDKKGHARMLRISKPRKPRKAEREAWKAKHGDKPMPLLWNETEEDIVGNWSYCARDVLTEKELSASLPDLSSYELRVWKMDQALNRRGVRVDLDMAHAALDIATRWKVRLNKELFAMTGVEKGTQRAQVKAWLLEHEGVDLPDTKADTLEWFIEHEELSGRAGRVMAITMDVNRTSTRKYETMINKSDDEGRVRDIMMYCGAERTGRWAGKGIQVHNYPARDLIVKDFDGAAELIKTGDLDWIHALYGDVMKFLSHSLRGSIIPSEGRDFMVADYAAIEARCVLWLAGALEALKIFTGGGDIYCDMASGIYAREIVKGRDLTERQFGKQAVLGLGYGMGFVTFLLTCRRYKIHFSVQQVLDIMGRHRMLKYIERAKTAVDGGKPGDTKDSKGVVHGPNYRYQLTEAREDIDKIWHELALMKYTVDVYRKRYPEVKAMWKAQEEAAIAITRSYKRGEDRVIDCGQVQWYMDGRFLSCRLPSGRPLRYCDPFIKPVKTSWGETRPSLRYYGIHSLTKQWKREHSYGGKLTENITQATARDIMAVAKLRAHEADLPYDPVMSVHDELVSEVDRDKGSLDEFEELMSTMPPWADGCPIEAEAERYGRYRK